MNNFGPHDRKSAFIFEIEGSPFSHAAPDLRSCSRRWEIGKGSRTKDRWKGSPSVSEVYRDGVAYHLGQVAQHARNGLVTRINTLNGLLGPPMRLTTLSVQAASQASPRGRLRFFSRVLNGSCMTIRRTYCCFMPLFHSQQGLDVVYVC